MNENELNLEMKEVKEGVDPYDVDAISHLQCMEYYKSKYSVSKEKIIKLNQKRRKAAKIIAIQKVEIEYLKDIVGINESELKLNNRKLIGRDKQITNIYTKNKQLKVKLNISDFKVCILTILSFVTGIGLTVLFYLLFKVM